MQLSETEASDYLNRLLAEGSTLEQLIQARRKHVHMDPSVAPILSAPLNRAPADTYQSDLPRQKLVEMAGRMTANHGHVHVDPPKDYSGLKADAENLESILNAWWQLTEESLGYMLQDALSDGQIVDGFAVLHCRHADESYPEVPEYEYVDALPDDPKQAARYRAAKHNSGDQKGSYRETEASREQRHNELKARAGCPYHIEVLDPSMFRWRQDMRSQIGAFVYYRRVELLDYQADLKQQDPKQRVGLTQDGKVRLYQHELPLAGEPSYQASTTSKALVVACFWTRDEWYEMVTTDQLFSSSGATPVTWTHVTGGDHAWGHPPAYLIPAHRFHTADIARAYTPALEGVFRLKPHYDRDMALLKGLAERTALPMTWIEVGPDGDPAFDEEGKATLLTRDALSSYRLPAGHKLVSEQTVINPAFVNAVMATKEEYEKAAPHTGFADTGVATQPNTLRLDIDQRSVTIRQFIYSQAVGLRGMFRDIVRDMARSDTPFWAFKVDQNGKTIPDSLVGIEPKQIEGLQVELRIDNVSSAERITLEQFGVELWEKGVISAKERDVDYRAIEDPIRRAKERMAEKIADEFVTKVITTKAAARWGAYVAMGSNGEFIGNSGQQMTPEQVFQAKGIQAPFPPQGQPGQNGGGGGMPSVNAGIGLPPSMPPLQGLQAPGTIPLPPLGGGVR